MHILRAPNVMILVYRYFNFLLRLRTKLFYSIISLLLFSFAASVLGKTNKKVDE